MITVSRNQWMDVAKGITIILMVLGHTSIPHPISNFIYSFHMPLFFIASGWMTNWTKYTVNEFIMNKVKTLAVPFVVYSSIVIILLTQEQSIITVDFSNDIYTTSIGGGVNGCLSKCCMLDGKDMLYGLFRFCLFL